LTISRNSACDTTVAFALLGARLLFPLGRASVGFVVSVRARRHEDDRALREVSGGRQDSISRRISSEGSFTRRTSPNSGPMTLSEHGGQMRVRDIVGPEQKAHFRVPPGVDGAAKTRTIS
jgi:hypothetical protein